MYAMKMSYIGDGMFSIRPRGSVIDFSPKGIIIGRVKIFGPDGKLRKIIEGKDLEKHKQMIFDERIYPEDRYNNNINN